MSRRAGGCKARTGLCWPFAILLVCWVTGAAAQEQVRGDRAPQPALMAVPTFHSIGLYWRPGSGVADREAVVRYRRTQDVPWKEGHSLWFDGRTHDAMPERSEEYRGSIVGLEPGTEYEIEVQVRGSEERALLVTRTWSEQFLVARRIEVPAKSNNTLLVDQSGSPAGYTLYAPKPGANASIDVAGASDYNVVIDASYVIVRGLTLQNAGRHGIALTERAHHVVIEHNDISGWGRVAENGFGVDEDSAISNNMNPLGQDHPTHRSIKAIVIQNNRIHHPRSTANSWRQYRALYRSPHPAGPQAITLWETGGNHVIRYNEIFSDSLHYFNDGIGGGENFGRGGAPGRDSDIYGNKISDCWDDAIESEGGNVNVRIWGNFIDKSYIMIAASPTVIGPLYIFRNVVYRGRYSSRHSFNTGIFIKAQSRTVGDQVWGGGRVYVFHNTAYRTSATEGTFVGISPPGSALIGYVSRNNVFDNTKTAAEMSVGDVGNDFDFDLFAAPLTPKSQHEQHGIQATPRYDRSVADAPWTLEAGTPGHDDGVVIPNFSDGFVGAAPDRGAQERGLPPLQFGVRAPAWD